MDRPSDVARPTGCAYPDCGRPATRRGHVVVEQLDMRTGRTSEVARPVPTCAAHDSHLARSMSTDCALVVL